jgi:hypothetical protein
LYKSCGEVNLSFSNLRLLVTPFSIIQLFCPRVGNVKIFNYFEIDVNLRVTRLPVVVGLPNNSYKPITNTAWVRARLCKLQKGCTRLAAASDKVYQLLAHGRWFSPGTPASSTTKTGRHDIADILLKVALNTKNKIKSNQSNNDTTSVI